MTDYAVRAFQIRAVREAGNVRRCHTQHEQGSHTVGHHSFGAASLILILHSDPSIDLVKAALWHDVAERWLGDMPATAKSAFPGLGGVYEQAEAEVTKHLGLFPALGRDDERWLRAVDTLDLCLWAGEAVVAGNLSMKPIYEKCCEALVSRHELGTLPVTVWEYFVRHGTLEGCARLNDVFDIALTDGLG